ncbi:MAG: phage tail protein [Fibrobacteres bacterium]|jgi:phage tail-like protein|nr:phage tail protein [Fibrobacterota bacterium]
MRRRGFLALIPALGFGMAMAASPAHRSQPSVQTAFGPFTLKVEIEGVTQGVFQSVEGLASESEVVSGEEYGAPAWIPGPSQGSRLILRRPYDPTLSGLWRWRQSVIDGDAQKRDGHIFVFDAGGKLVAHWVFRKGWPSRWEVPKLEAGVPNAAEEVVEIVHQGLSLESQ